MHGPDRDRYSEYLASFRKWAADADLIYSASAQETGGVRHIRYVTAADCTPTVLNIELPASALAEFSATNNALAAKGLDRRDRKYMIFVGHPGLLRHRHLRRRRAARPDQPEQLRPLLRPYGLRLLGRPHRRARAGPQPRRGQQQRPEHQPRRPLHRRVGRHVLLGHARTTRRCATSAPTRRPRTSWTATTTTTSTPAPRPDSYLATHWNIADNQFLMQGKGGNPNPDPNPTPTTEAHAHPDQEARWRTGRDRRPDPVQTPPW